MSAGNEPAYPVAYEGRDGQMIDWGMTKREAFAMAAMQLQPGVAEIVTAAGLHCRDGYTVWSDAETKLWAFNDWWGTLTNEARFALAAKVQVMHADALLAELERGAK